MTARRYRRRPEPVEAVKFTGDNAAEIIAWSGGKVVNDTGDRALMMFEPRFAAIVPGDWVARDGLGNFERKFAGEFEADYEVDGQAIGDTP